MRPLFSFLLRCACSLGTPGFVRLSQPLVLVSDHASCTNFLRHINSFLLVLLDAFFSFSLMLFWGLHASFVLSSALLRLFSWYSWFCEALSASGFLFLTMLLVQTS